MLFRVINVAAIVGLRIRPFIATLASILAGVTPWTMVVVVVVALLAWLVLERTPLGRTVLAVGGDEHASRLMRLSVNIAKVAAYLFNGACAGLAGVFPAAGIGAGQPFEGVGWELSAIAAVVVGGNALTGERGSITATAASALLLGLIFNVLNFENGKGTF